MKLNSVTALVASCLVGSALAAPRLETRDEDKFNQGLPISKTGKGGPISGRFLTRYN